MGGSRSPRRSPCDDGRGRTRAALQEAGWGVWAWRGTARARGHGGGTPWVRRPWLHALDWLRGERARARAQRRAWYIGADLGGKRVRGGTGVWWRARRRDATVRGRYHMRTTGTPMMSERIPMRMGGACLDQVDGGAWRLASSWLLRATGGGKENCGVRGAGCGRIEGRAGTRAGLPVVKRGRSRGHESESGRTPNRERGLSANARWVRGGNSMVRGGGSDDRRGRFIPRDR